MIDVAMGGRVAELLCKWNCVLYRVIPTMN
jgi:hypothetical protein